MTEEDIKKKKIPSELVSEWLMFNGFMPGQFLLLASDEPEFTLVWYIRP